MQVSLPGPPWALSSPSPPSITSSVWPPTKLSPPPRADIKSFPFTDVLRDVLPSGTMHGMDSVPAGVLDPTMRPGATGLLRLTVQGTLLGRGRLTGPYLHIDGDPVPVAFGENPIKVHAGRHQVHATMSFLWPFGGASLDVHIPDGGELDVWYAPSFSYYVKGRLGTERPDAWSKADECVRLAAV